MSRTQTRDAGEHSGHADRSGSEERRVRGAGSVEPIRSTRAGSTFPGPSAPFILSLPSTPCFGSLSFFLPTKVLPPLAYSLQHGQLSSASPGSVTAGGKVGAVGGLQRGLREGAAEPSGVQSNSDAHQRHPTLHTAKTHLRPLFVLLLTLLRVSVIFSALSHFTKVPLLFPEPRDVGAQKRTWHRQ